METFSRNGTARARRRRRAVLASRRGFARAGAGGAALGTVRRTAGFVARLLARTASRSERGRPLEMALRRPPAPETRTIVHRGAPTLVSHHQVGPAIHLGVALQVVLTPPAPSPPALPRILAAPSMPRPILQTVTAHRHAERGPAGPPPSLAVPPHPTAIALRLATGPVVEDPGTPAAARAVTTVAPILRREERVRLETVVRRTTLEIASPSSTLRGQPVASSNPPEPPRAVRRASPPPPTMPPTIADAEVARLTDRVVQRIERRVVSQRERMGGH